MGVTQSSVVDETILNLGIFIVGYPEDNEICMDRFKRWSPVFDKVVLFTDSRLDKNANFWLEQSEFEIHDFATMEIPILDWYIENANFLKKSSLAKYITFYSDLCRWFVINHLNNLYPSDVNGYTQATYDLVESETSTTNLKEQLVRQSQDKFVIYGNDRNFMLDGELTLRTSDNGFTSRVCLGFNMGTKYLLKKGHFRGYSIFPFENMITLSLVNPDEDEAGVFSEFKKFISESWLDDEIKLQLLSENGISISTKEKEIYLSVKLPQHFAGTFVNYLKDYQHLTIIDGDKKNANFLDYKPFKKHWSKNGGNNKFIKNKIHIGPKGGKYVIINNKKKYIK